jgi:hypothetical protein
MRFERIFSTVVIILISAAIISGIIRTASDAAQRAVTGLAAAKP